jgi:Na+/H+-translocating membrane pyrophosphatase
MIDFRIDLNSAFKTLVEISSKLTVLVFSISLFTFIFYAFIINTFLESEILTFDSICGYGFGCSFSALFCRISGGIFTKGSDISCDIIGKLENKFVENDQKNPSSIADNIGDLVGDLTGSVLDLITIFNESISAISIIISHSNINQEFRYTLILFLLSLFITSILVFIIIELCSAKYREVFIIELERYH